MQNTTPFKRALQMGDMFLQSIGNIGIASSELVGGIVLAPTELKLNHIKHVAGGGIIVAASVIMPSSNIDHVKTTSVKQAESVLGIAIAERPPIRLGISDALMHELKREKVGSKGIGQKELDHLQKIVNYEGSTPFRDAFKNMAPLSQWKFYNLIADYHRATGELVNVKSAWRSKYKQQALRDSMPKNMAADACGSAHAMAAMDIDRKGNTSRQVDLMAKLGLLNKHRLWVPPEVGEPWHIEDPDAVYFRYWSKDDQARGIYRNNVCANLTGVQHEAKRLKDGVFTVKDSVKQLLEIADYWLNVKGIKGQESRFLKDYLMLSVRSESLYGRMMLSRTGARGWWMFTGKTAKQYQLKYPMQLMESVRATIELAQDNMRQLKKMGIPQTHENVYLAHMVGARGLSIVLRANGGAQLSTADAKVFDAVVSRNMSSENFERYYERDGNGEISRKPVVSTSVVSAEFFRFFGERFRVYTADNDYVLSLLNSSAT